MDDNDLRMCVTETKKQNVLYQSFYVSSCIKHMLHFCYLLVSSSLQIIYALHAICLKNRQCKKKEKKYLSVHSLMRNSCVVCNDNAYIIVRETFLLI